MSKSQVLEEIRRRDVFVVFNEMHLTNQYPIVFTELNSLQRSLLRNFWSVFILTITYKGALSSDLFLTCSLLFSVSQGPDPAGQVCAQLLGRVRLFAHLQGMSRQAPQSMGLSRQDYWSGLPCPPPGELPHPGITPASVRSPASSGGFTTGATWEAPLQAMPPFLISWFLAGFS